MYVLSKRKYKKCQKNHILTISYTYLTMFLMIGHKRKIYGVGFEF